MQVEATCTHCWNGTIAKLCYTYHVCKLTYGTGGEIWGMWEGTGASVEVPLPFKVSLNTGEECIDGTPSGRNYGLHFNKTHKCSTYVALILLHAINIIHLKVPSLNKRPGYYLRAINHHLWHVGAGVGR